MSRDLDWRSYLNRLTYCYGCGRFGMPQAGSKQHLPRGWALLYQPHRHAPPALPCCSLACKDKVRSHMQGEPIFEPLVSADDIAIMPVEQRLAMMAEIQHAVEEMLAEELVHEREKDIPEPDEDHTVSAFILRVPERGDTDSPALGEGDLVAANDQPAGLGPEDGNQPGDRRPPDAGEGDPTRLLGQPVPDEPEKDSEDPARRSH